MEYWADGAGFNGKKSRTCVVDEDGITYLTEIEGNRTNNEAEYLAMLHALVICEKCSTIYTDSKLVESQSKGQWKCREPRLLRHIQLVKRLKEIKNANIEWVPRKDNLAGHILEAKR